MIVKLKTFVVVVIISELTSENVFKTNALTWTGGGAASVVGLQAKRDVASEDTMVSVQLKVLNLELLK